MANVFDYIKKNGDKSFSKKGFCDIDNLIFSEMAYFNFEKAVQSCPTTKRAKLCTAVKKVFSIIPKQKMIMGLIVPKKIKELVDKASQTKRFGNLHVSNYTNVIDEISCCQFSAITFHAKQFLYVAFRGTDDTVVGWRENAEMMTKCPVQSQILATEYLNKVASLFPDLPLYVGGHSKGGNLATYATIHAKKETQNRIVRTFSNDGQGFLAEFINKRKFESVKEKIVHIIPEKDVVGVIFDEFCGQKRIVKSSAQGIFQHDGLTWKIKDSDFVTLPATKKSAIIFQTGINSLFQNTTKDTKIELTNNLYTFVKETNLSTLMECKKSSLKLIRSFLKLNPNVRKFIINLVKTYLSATNPLLKQKK